jgi:hypothetical protein
MYLHGCSRHFSQLLFVRGDLLQLPAGRQTKQQAQSTTWQMYLSHWVRRAGALGSLAGMGKPLSPSGEGMEERKK